MNPYETPRTAPEDPSPAPAKSGDEVRRSNKTSEFFSWSGSFSRAELLMATVALGLLAIFISALHNFFPALVPQSLATVLTYCLYPIWGGCLGKRSRDLGTTFTYGMVVGMLFPILGLIFLFQPGAKARPRRNQSAAS
jgi:hypothetical protein